MTLTQLFFTALLPLISISAGASTTESFFCQGPIVRGQVTATVELYHLDFPNFKLKLNFDSGSNNALLEGEGKYSYSQDVSSGQVSHLYQIRTSEGRGQLSIVKDQNGQEIKIVAGGIVDKITPYVFAIRCKRN